MKASLHAGRLLARRYRLIDQIGAGGMSVIWRARDEVLDRIVALKVLAPSLAADARFRDMVREEARSAAQLVHPHVTAVHDYGETVAPDGGITSFVVMELLAGEELEHRLTAGPLPWPEAVEIGAQVAEALAAAHRLGIVHRDITPANVMMTQVGAKVLDFGIATRVGAPDEDEDGGTFGTPAYVAPERLDGAPAQPATDVYSLGVLLFETLTGQPPYAADTWEQLSAALDEAGPPTLDGVPGLPPAVADVCLRCLARDPRRRPTAHQLATVLRDQLLPADPQAATMLAPTVTLPALPAPAAPGPDLRHPAVGPHPVAAAPPRPATDDEPARPAPDGDASAGAGRRRSGGRRPRSLLVVVGVVVVGGGALLTPTLLPDEQPSPGGLPTSGPVVAPSATPSSPAPTSTRPSPRPTRPAPTTSGATSLPPAGGLIEAANRMDGLIEAGLAAGEIRDDVGVDLRNLLRNAVAATGEGALTTAVDRLRAKIGERQREGSISPAYAQRLDAAAAQLAATQA
ncbi:serine/threonine-protein kinase [Micromonospora narathiwatensis]|uniref:non-specific serine/threonine protein kinase n=1 Tax=Micromonospora narathiwatensis TaxID=299146 RepID=A0A1A9A3G0_9ACTN|nr:serine/threonine-protein kinase [Micromonospora narathiwatensis]SBT50666.1 serine/threonine protein kinase [Micromonospora narathiwatensis]